MPYTVGQFPNLLNHQTQHEAKAAIDASKIVRLLKSGCSPDILTLLCSVLAPPCNETQTPVLPCKGLCKRAMKGCRDQLKKLGITLNSAMRCRSLPKQGVSKCFSGSWPKNTPGELSHFSRFPFSLWLRLARDTRGQRVSLGRTTKYFTNRPLVRTTIYCVENRVATLKDLKHSRSHLLQLYVNQETTT